MRPGGHDLAEGSEPQVEGPRGVDEGDVYGEGAHHEVQAGHGARQRIPRAGHPPADRLQWQPRDGRLRHRADF